MHKIILKRKKVIKRNVNKKEVCLAPHTPSMEAIDNPVGSVNGIQGARHTRKIT